MGAFRERDIKVFCLFSSEKKIFLPQGWQTNMACCTADTRRSKDMHAAAFHG